MKALTLVYLLAAATAFVGASAAANDVCVDSYHGAQTVALVDGENVANKCVFDYSETYIDFHANLTKRTSFKLTGGRGITYGDFEISITSEFPVAITFENAKLGSIYVSSSNFFPAGSSFTLSGCTVTSDVDLYANAVDTVFTVANNLFTYNDGYAFDMETYYGGFSTGVTADIYSNQFWGGGAYFDVDSCNKTSYKFRDNVLEDGGFEFYTYVNDNTIAITGNKFYGTYVDLETDNGPNNLLVSNNAFDVCDVDMYAESSGTMRVESNAFTCAAYESTSVDIGLDYLPEDAAFSFAKNTFGSGCELYNKIKVDLPSTFAANSAIAFDDNRLTIGAVPSDSSPLIYFEDAYLDADGPAAFSFSGNDFRFANGVKPADLADAEVLLADFDYSSGVGRAMKKQSGSDMTVQMADNVVDGTVLKSVADMAKYFGNVEVIADAVGISTAARQYSAAPAAASVYTAAAAIVACLAVMVVA